MRENVLIVIVLLCNIAINAAPAWPDSVLVNQSDGTNLWVYDRGDEFYHWVETTDGYVILKNVDGVFEYAFVDKNAQLLPSGVKAQNVLSKNTDELNYAKSQVVSVHNAMTEIYNESREEVQRLRTPHIPSSPVTGVRKILTILVDFTDKPITYTTNDFDALMNEIGYSENGNAGSTPRREHTYHRRI
ncbi:MAG: hypothetical protein J6T76_04400 [Paludibacteraceae bacterium]|nr:hypothetical protein [Paludibacteraceae bacterium]